MGSFDGALVVDSPTSPIIGREMTKARDSLRWKAQKMPLIFESS